MKRRSFFKTLVIGYFSLKSIMYADSPKIPKLEEKELLDVPKIQQKLCFIGVGGGGANIVEDIATMDSKHKFIQMNTDKQALRKQKLAHKIFLYNRDALGCGGKVECGLKSVTPQVKKQLKLLTKNISKVYVISTLGGGVGSGATPEIVKYLQISLNKTVVVLSVMPFRFEGKKRRVIANISKKNIDIYASQHFILENDELLNTKFSQSVRATFKGMSRKIFRVVEQNS